MTMTDTTRLSDIFSDPTLSGEERSLTKILSDDYGIRVAGFLPTGRRLLVGRDGVALGYFTHIEAMRLVVDRRRLAEMPRRCIRTP